MPCTVSQRRRHRELARELRAFPFVITVNTVAPLEAPSNRWTTELVVRRGEVPACVLSVIGAHGLSIADVTKRDRPVQTVATVR